MPRREIPDIHHFYGSGQIDKNYYKCILKLVADIKLLPMHDIRISTVGQAQFFRQSGIHTSF